MKNYSEEFLHFLSNFLAGGSAAAFAVSVMAPIERAKIILQTQKGATNIPYDKEYKGLVDCLTRIYREEGFRAYWRGNASAVLRCFPFQALNFSLKEFIKETFFLHNHKDSARYRLFMNVISGGMAGVCALTLTYPLDFARTRMAVDVGSKQRVYHGAVHCISTAIKTRGIRYVYRGVGLSLGGVFLYRSLYFGLFDTLVECIKPEYSHILWIEAPIAEVSAVSAGIVSYPIDTVRRRLMVQNFSGKACPHKPHVVYKNEFECMKYIYFKEGIRGFFRGCTTNLIRGTGGAIVLVLFDRIAYHFEKIYHENLSIPAVYHAPREIRVNETFSMKDLYTKPCKIFKDRCVFCNF